jgi:hypothetical protein
MGRVSDDKRWLSSRWKFGEASAVRTERGEARRGEARKRRVMRPDPNDRWRDLKIRDEMG